ncbi:MAG: ATP-binding protein [Pseudomonadales bacterium]|nr:ATP-binding protein [Pseudomonadales bacterium]
MTTPSGIPTYSLQSRLLLAFSVLLFVFLGLTGIVVDRAFGSSVEAGAVDRLQVQIYLLLGAADEQDGEFYFLEDLQEPRFSNLNSGLYGYISSSSEGELWRSDSASTFTPPSIDFLRERVSVGETSFERMAGGERTFFRLSYGILWEDGISEYSFSVIEDAEPYYAEIADFRTNLWFWLGGAAVLLLFMQLLLLRWGLSPLSRMAGDLKRIESGETDKLESDYPQELQGVTANLNLLIESERKQQQRYRTTLGDLAHSLKTPLAVVSGILPEIRSPEKAESGVTEKIAAVSDQLDRMNQIVTYQLQRAVQSNQTSTLARHANIAAAIEKVVAALQKVYVEKEIKVETKLNNSILFSGDERDLLELLGNVLDNAFKYGNNNIRVEARPAGDKGSGVLIRIEDDGQGIPNEKLEYVLQRGARADTLAQGQGIGLAVVTDIVESYSGEIRVLSSELGGAAIEIEFP